MKQKELTQIHGRGAAASALSPEKMLTPEEEELERKKASLAKLEAQLADRELELASFRADLVHFEKIYFAPEAPEQASRGRKPSPQFLFDARDEFDIDLAHSYMIGDKLIDLECGWNAGVKQSILVRTGYGAEQELVNAEKLGRALVVDALPEAAEAIVELAERGPAADRK